MLETASFIVSQPTPEAQRLSVYVLASVFGLLVCGFVSLAKELRQEATERR
jgi:hypothetical protein